MILSQRVCLSPQNDGHSAVVLVEHVKCLCLRKLRSILRVVSGVGL